MPDPLTVLLDAIWIEARWQLKLATGKLHRSRYFDADSLIGRNVFWVTVIKGKA